MNSSIHSLQENRLSSQALRKAIRDEKVHLDLVRPTLTSILFCVLALNLWKSTVGARSPIRCSNVGRSVMIEGNHALLPP